MGESETVCVLSYFLIKDANVLFHFVMSFHVFPSNVGKSTTMKIIRQSYTCKPQHPPPLEMIKD